MSISCPPIDGRNFQLLLSELRRFAPYYISEWNPTNENDVGVAVSKIFSGMMMYILDRMNKVPKRQYTEFLNMLGTKLSPGQPSLANVVFYLSEGVKQDVLVQSDTRILAAATEAHKELNFETQDNVLITKSKLVEIYSAAGGNDVDVICSHTAEYLQENTFVLFSGDNLQRHYILIGDSEVFRVSKNSVIQIFLQSDGLEELKNVLQKASWEYNWKIDPVTGQEICGSSSNFDPSVPIISVPDKLIEITLSFKQESVMLNGKSDIEFNELQSIKSRWIRCSFPVKEYVSYQSLIKSTNIRRITASIGPKNQADNLFDNDLQITAPANSLFFPFGIRLDQMHCFYIASEDVFSRKNGNVTISFECPWSNRLFDREGLLHLPWDLSLSWEYWNGKNWANLKVTTDNIQFGYVSAPTDENQEIHQSLNFICPLDTSPTTVNGNESYWIRARIVSYFGANPPRIKDLRLNLVWAKEIEHCITYNDLGYQNQISNVDGSVIPFTPFYGLENNYSNPSIYLGFSAKIQDGPISLYLSIKEAQISEARDQFDYLSFSYFSENGTWRNLDTEDGTNYLSKSGYIRFLVPNDFASKLLFGKDLFWIMIIDKKRKFGRDIDKIWLESASQKTLNLPELKNVFLNSVRALNVVKTEDEILGSSNGEQKQSFNFSRIPVISTDRYKNQVWIDENKTIVEEERVQLRNKREIIEKVDEQGRITETLVLWHEIEDIYLSELSSRDYQIDRASGQIQFGDGSTFGMVPPIGVENIRSNYSYVDQDGGGNVGAGEINSLKRPIPFVESVVNTEPATGGMGTEPVESALERGSQIIKHRGQPVTYEDYEWIIREAFPSIAKVKCMPTTTYNGKFKPGYVTIVLIPRSTDVKPMPSLDLRGKIEAYLEERASNVLVSASHLKVIKPLYLRISVAADIYVESIDLAPSVKRIATDALHSFLHPIYGGSSGSGWEFGTEVCASDIITIFEKIREVDHVENLSIHVELEPENDFQDSKNTSVILHRETISLENVGRIMGAFPSIPYSLIYSGEHDLTVKLQSEKDGRR